MPPSGQIEASKTTESIAEYFEVSIVTSVPKRLANVELLVDPEPIGTKISRLDVWIIVWVCFSMTVSVLTIGEGWADEDLVGDDEGEGEGKDEGSGFDSIVRDRLTLSSLAELLFIFSFLISQ